MAARLLLVLQHSSQKLLPPPTRARPLSRHCAGQTACGNECTNLATDKANCGECGNPCTAIQSCQAGQCTDLFSTGLTWATASTGTISGIDPWVISQENTVIRFNVERSANCGGTNANIQSGTATATITVGPIAALFSFQLSGAGELENSNFDLMTLKFDGNQVGFANAAGGGQGCVDGPVVFALQTTLPIVLPPNTVHTFELLFTTAGAPGGSVACIATCRFRRTLGGRSISSEQDSPTYTSTYPYLLSQTRFSTSTASTSWTSPSRPRFEQACGRSAAAATAQVPTSAGIIWRTKPLV